MMDYDEPDVYEETDDFDYPSAEDSIQCDMCGEMFIPDEDTLMPFCDDCLAEQL